MDDDKIQCFMQEHGGDWIKWYKNPPLASHMGGVLERYIRSARAILSSLLKTHKQSLDDEYLITLWQRWKVYWTQDLLLLKQLMILQAFNHFLELTLWPWNQRSFHHLRGSSWSLMFSAGDAGDAYNILPTNFGLAREKSISSHFKNVKNGQAEEETLG